MAFAGRLVIACAAFAIAGSAGAAPFTLSSPAFKDGEAIPLRFTQTGTAPSGALKPGELSAAVSPPLAWSDPPPGTKAFVLLLRDHADILMWAVVNIPSQARALPEDATYAEIMAAMQGHLTGEKAVMVTPCCDGSK